MSAGEKPQGPRGRDRVIATIGIETNRLSSHDTKLLKQSAADIVLNQVVERLHDQLVMDALVLRVADELQWDDARCDLIKQHQSVRFHSDHAHEQAGFEKKIPTVEIKHHHDLNIIRDMPGAKEAEKEMAREKGTELERKMELEAERKMEAEEVYRNGERCFDKSDRAVRPSVADFQSNFQSQSQQRITINIKTQLASAW